MSLPFDPHVLIPVKKDILADWLTPVSVYLTLGKDHSFLLESVTGGVSVSRYSFIGLDPFCTFISYPDATYVTYDNKTVPLTGNPIDELASLISLFSLEDTDLDIPFLGGAVGYFSWETMRHIEPIVFSAKEASPFPHIHFVFPRQLLVFDHAQRQLSIIVLSDPDKVADANARIAEIEAQLLTPIDVTPIHLDRAQTVVNMEAISSNYSKANFMSDVERVKHHIVEGDIFQLVLSQQFQIPSQEAPFDVYRRLRSINPSPYMFYFNFSDYQIVGSSPEILSKCEDGRAIVRPIAGTRKRPSDPTQDAAVIDDLCQDEKERAEHLMLVDLGRNDLGRVCEYGSVQTMDFMTVEKYSHVFHMVSQVEGQLRPGQTAFDLFKATFPAGTLSGAPKIRAVELIDEIEPHKRGPYGGALGYFDLRGNMDLCIIIRTFFVQDGTYFLQAGAGIVADSVPENEYYETLNKAKGMMLSLQCGADRS